MKLACRTDTTAAVSSERGMVIGFQGLLLTSPTQMNNAPFFA